MGSYSNLLTPGFALLHLGLQSVAVPQLEINQLYNLEESHRLLIVRDKHVLGLAVVVEHHQVIFAAKA